MTSSGIRNGHNGAVKFPTHLVNKMYGNYLGHYFLRQKMGTFTKMDSKTKYRYSSQIPSDVSNWRMFSARKMFLSFHYLHECLKHRRWILIPSVSVVHADDKVSEKGKDAVIEKKSIKEEVKSESYGESKTKPEGKREFKITDPITDEEVHSFLLTETGWDRIRRMYSKDPVTGRYSDEINGLLPIFTSTFLFGGIYSILLRIPVAKHEFNKSSYLVKHVAMDPHRMARARYDYLFKECVRTGAKFGSLMSLFVGSIALTAKSISVYRNKTSMWDYTIGGIITGALFRIHVGPQAILVGGVLLGTMATLMGALVSAISHSFNATQDKVHFEEIRTLMESGSITRPRLLERKTTSSISSTS